MDPSTLDSATLTALKKEVYLEPEPGLAAFVAWQEAEAKKKADAS